MDQVLLKYTEYDQPHESQNNSDIVETIHRYTVCINNKVLKKLEMENYNESPKNTFNKNIFFCFKSENLTGKTYFINFDN